MRIPRGKGDWVLSGKEKEAGPSLGPGATAGVLVATVRG